MNKDKKCETIQALFADYLDGTLKAKPKLMSMVDAHLNHCGVCRRAWEGYRMAVQSLHQLGSQGVEVPRELYPRLCNA
ncbi:MAG TPA: hypothetical protein EYP10_04305, partial [Armatimonadetes bacterium]|nr:hypothetical protein [Armatimonadota bacterium]